MASTPVNGVTTRRPYWLLVTAVPFVPAFLTALRSYLTSRIQHGRVDWHDISFVFFDWLVLSLLTPLIYALARQYPIRRKRIGRAVTAHLFGALVFSLTWAALGVLLGWILNRSPAGDFNWSHGLLKIYVAWVVITFPWAVFIYLLMLGSVFASTYYREARERESQQARLAAQLAEARLGALRMQLNPHFLFNSLNAIAALVRDHKTEDASEMLGLLGEVLRQVLQERKQAEIPLAEELDFIEKYLAIEQVRFSDRLRVRFSIGSELRSVLVPEFILQPLVENAVRHGIARRIEAGDVHVKAREESGDLVMSVEDNGPGYQPTAEGLGLKNTRERLDTLYGTAGHLEVVTNDDGWTIAKVRFPLKESINE